MGAWGDGIWQNDSAMDLAAGSLDEATLARAIRATAAVVGGKKERVAAADRTAMKAVFGEVVGDLRDFPSAAWTIYALGALVAFARGRPGRVLPRAAWWVLGSGALAKVGTEAAVLVEAALADDQRPDKYEAGRGPGKRYFAERRELLKNLRQAPQGSLAAIQLAKVQTDVGDPLA